MRERLRAGPMRGTPPVTADRTTALRNGLRRRLIAGAALLPLLALAACGYGSEKKDDTSAAAATAGSSSSGKKLSADTVKIGYFANLTHGTALVGLARNGLIRKALGSTAIRTSVFNA